MVPFAASDLKDIFTIRLKKRQDAYTDQFSRIFMVKMLMISSIVMGVDWFQDTINCMIPAVDLHKVREQFVHSACWIQGMTHFFCRAHNNIILFSKKLKVIHRVVRLNSSSVSVFVEI